MTLTRVSSPLPDDLERLVQEIIGCCLAVHTVLGPGMSEWVYVTGCCLEFDARRITYEREKALPVRYRGVTICHQRVDLFVGGRVVVEVKVVERIHPVHIAQAANYLRLSRARVALVANFNSAYLKDGLRRVVL
jgi:GxxExxY protein